MLSFQWRAGNRGSVGVGDASIFLIRNSEEVEVAIIQFTLHLESGTFSLHTPYSTPTLSPLQRIATVRAVRQRNQGKTWHQGSHG